MREASYIVDISVKDHPTTGFAVVLCDCAQSQYLDRPRALLVVSPSVASIGSDMIVPFSAELVKMGRRLPFKGF